MPGAERYHNIAAIGDHKRRPGRLLLRHEALNGIP
jgi:hypothetical protein